MRRSASDKAERVQDLMQHLELVDLRLYAVTAVFVPGAVHVVIAAL